MRSLRFISILLPLCLFLSCDKQQGRSQEKEQQELTEQFQELVNLVRDQTCVDSQNWDFEGYGLKACGVFVGDTACPKGVKTSFF